MRISAHLLCFMLGSLLLAASAAASKAGDSKSSGVGGWSGAPPRRVLYFTKSAGFEHSVVKRPAPDQLSHSEKVLAALGKQHRFEVTCSKDGSLFTPENIARYDVLV